MFKRIILLLSVSLLLASGVSGPSGKFIASPVDENETKWVDSIMNTLSPRDKIAQLFMIAAYSNLGDKHIESIKQEIKKNKVGGLIFFQGTPEKQVELTNTYQALSKVPLLIGMDAEWGVGMRLKDIISFPRQMTLGALRDNQLIYDLGTEFARQCKILGVHVNFAPSVDVNNNHDNPVINVRSFGENQYIVAKKGLALVSGMQDHQVLACAKHFPGHGDTETDSHQALPEINCTKDRLDTLELIPFKELIDHGVSMVMVGHLSVPALENKPASISKSVINDLLFNELGFQGIATSDALNMKGVKDNADGENVTVAALKAGNDILLMPNGVEENLEEIEKAINEKELSQEDLDKRCRKILVAKYRAGLNKKQKLDTKNIRERLNSKEAYALRNKIIESAITLVSNKDGILPIKEVDQAITYLCIGGKGSTFNTQLSKYSKVNRLDLDANPNKTSLDATEKKLKKSQLIIVGYHSINNKTEDNFGIDMGVIEMLQKLSNKKKILVCFGTPYAISKIEQPNELFNSIVVAYDNTIVAQNKAAQMIFGGLPFKGELPVSPCELYPVGSGIITEADRLSYLEPEEVEISDVFIRKADSLAELGIKEKAYPGCQIVAAYKGHVFYEKAFGNHTYGLKSKPVDMDDVYDVASVTKVSATLPLIMKMVDDHILNLDNTLRNYVTFQGNAGDKKNIKIRELLLHEAGLVAWIPFHYKYFETPDHSPALTNRKGPNYKPLPGTRQFIHNNYRLSSDYFSTTNKRQFSIPVANNLYTNELLKKDMYLQIDTSKLQSKIYRYSDLSFIYLQRILEEYYKESIKTLIQKSFYAPLGMYNSMYNPAGVIEKERIPPTEDDKIFRRQQMQGYVHDQGAAMFGGISGHAGLFSTADDLAKLYQMILNGGTYGGKKYLDESTIKIFTSYSSKISRRGLGYDKPERDSKKEGPVGKDASKSSFGHTGFTGTMVWVDPERELVYIFLSNRIYPSAENNKLSRLGTRSEILSQFIQGIDQLQKPTNKK